MDTHFIIPVRINILGEEFLNIGDIVMDCFENQWWCSLLMDAGFPGQEQFTENSPLSFYKQFYNLYNLISVENCSSEDATKYTRQLTMHTGNEKNVISYFNRKVLAPTIHNSREPLQS